MDRLIGIQLAQKEMLEKFVSNYKKDGKDRRNKAYYVQRLENFKKMWIEFESGHKEILTHKYLDKTFDEKKYEYFSKDVFSDMEEFFHHIYSQIQERFEKEYPPEQMDLKGTQSSPKVIAKDSQSPCVKLPKIYLEKFNGDYRKWPTFHDLFKTLVHDNASISHVQKLQYLKLHLSGEPEQLLRHFQVTDNNYVTAWNLLRDRYNNKRILVNTHLKVLLSQSPIFSESAQGVKGLLDTTTECLQALDNLNVSTADWDPLIIYIVVQKLPSETHQLWEQTIGNTKDLPSWKALQEFLECRFRTLEAVASKTTHPNKESRRQMNRSKSGAKSFHVATNISCVICLGNHSIRQCPTFMSYNSSKRLEVVKTRGLCINCLGYGHILINCPSQSKCWHCKQRHHSLLHRKPNETNQVPENANINSNKIHPQKMTANYGSLENANSMSSSHIGNPIQPSSSSLAWSANAPEFNPKKVTSTSTNVDSFLINKSLPEQVLLATAMVKVISPTGREQIVRALIDQGSQASFLTESVAQDLQLKREAISANISGLGKRNVSQVNHRVNFTIKSLKNDNTLEVSGLILKKLTDLLPTKAISYHKWDHLNNLELADPQFCRPGKTDLLLGADIYSKIMMGGLVKSINGSPIAQQTVLGWILSGEISIKSENSLHVNNFHLCTELEDQLKRFWELEEVHEASAFTNEEELCEKHFEQTVRRLSDGRYEVELPLRKESDSQHLGKSRNIAVSRLLQMEARFRRDVKLKKDYSKCLNEYIELGHMTRVHTSEDEHLKRLGHTTTYTCSYLPHHGVVKESSATTKLRVVFDASRPTQSGVSLNDMMFKGPVIQDELATLLIRWRKHQVAFSADIEKMYRQVRVRHPFTEYQRIVWRNSPTDPIEDYKLLTVTFGTKTAPYLATRVLKQLALDEKDNYPMASSIILSDFYVDDLISGADNIESALKAQQQLNKIMKSGGFSLRKWSSNCKELLESLPTECCEPNLPLQLNSEESIRTLGTHWNPQSDTLSYSVHLCQQSVKWTKRNVLSETSRLFDPLGLVAPIIISAKIMLQKLWLTDLGWDEEIPPNLKNEYINYRNSITEVENIKINRWIQFSQTNKTTGFGGLPDVTEHSNIRRTTSRQDSVPNSESADVSNLSKSKKSIKTKALKHEYCIFSLSVLATLIICAVASIFVYQYYLLAPSRDSHDERLKIVQRILKEVPLIDGHNDMAWNARKYAHSSLELLDLSHELDHKSVWHRPAWSQADIPRLKQGLVGAQIWSAYVPCEAQGLDAVQLALEQ